MRKRARNSIPKKRRTGRKIVNAKKATVDGIDFKSGLEVTMYQLLKENGIIHSYESTSYLIFDPFEYGGESYQRPQKRSPNIKISNSVTKISYTPDFVGDGEEWFIECKGRANERFPLVWKLFKKLMHKRKNPPLIFIAKNRKDCEEVVKKLLQKGYGKR